jgi:hypothetical protein
MLLMAPLGAQIQMPNPKEISGVALPAADVPVGTVSVRVVRGNFDHNLPNQPVEFTIDGKTRVEHTNADGRALVSNLKSGVHVRAVAVVAGERLESQEATIASSGIKIVLVATDPDTVKREAEDQRLAAGPAVKGMVVMGPESRIVAEFADDRLNVFCILDILNSSRTPVDIGGPVVVDLPRAARGAALMEGSSKQATVSGPRVTVTGPFAPGSTSVQVGYEMPFDGGTASLEHKWSVPLQQLTVLVPQTGGLSVRSPQVATTQEVRDQGAPVILMTGGAIPAGQPVVVEISGLPHHPIWPRYLALTLAGVLMSMGIWAAVFPKPRRRAA